MGNANTCKRAFTRGRRGQIAWQAIGVLLAVFIVGALSGLAYASKRAEPPNSAPPRRLPPQLEGLGLTFEQNEKIRVILQAQKPHVDSLMSEIMPRLRARSDSTIAQIRNVMTPDQRKAFDDAMPKGGMAPGLPGPDGRAGDRPPPPNGAPPGGPPR